MWPSLFNQVQPNCQLLQRFSGIDWALMISPYGENCFHCGNHAYPQKIFDWKKITIYEFYPGWCAIKGWRIKRPAESRHDQVVFRAAIEEEKKREVVKGLEQEIWNISFLQEWLSGKGDTAYLASQQQCNCITGWDRRRENTAERSMHCKCTGKGSVLVGTTFPPYPTLPSNKQQWKHCQNDWYLIALPTSHTFCF